MKSLSMISLTLKKRHIKRRPGLQRQTRWDLQVKTYNVGLSTMQ